jgi:hypothetical protein
MFASEVCGLVVEERKEESGLVVEERKAESGGFGLVL